MALDPLPLQDIADFPFSFQEWLRKLQQFAGGTSGVLPPSSGGTGLSTYAIGDLIYASAVTTLSALADVATGNALISGGVGTPPSWGKIGLATHISGTLGVGNGGTSLTTLTAHAVYVGNGSSAPTALSVGASNTFLKGLTGADPAFGTATLASADFANQGTTTTVLHGNAAGNPSFGQVAISTDVSGLGTNVATFLATPSSANLAAAVTDETGTGKLIFSDGTLAITAGQTLTVTTGGTLGSAAYTASSAYDVAGAAAAVTPTTLGLVIGTNVQAYDADLTTWAGITPTLTNHGVVTAGVSTLGTVAPSTSGNVLTSNGIDWVSSANPAGGQLLGAAASKAISWNAQTIAEDITVGAAQNALSLGPITVTSGFAVTVTSGGKWMVMQ